jgi:hypothetical protein
VEFTPDKSGSSLERLYSHVALCLENPVYLRATGVHLFSHLRFGNALLVQRSNPTITDEKNASSATAFFVLFPITLYRVT